MVQTSFTVYAEGAPQGVVRAAPLLSLSSLGSNVNVLQIRRFLLKLINIYYHLTLHLIHISI